MFNGKRIFVTGGTGSWGHELIKQLLEKYDPQEIVVYSRGEHKQVEMRQEFPSPKIKFVIGDVRDFNILSLAMKGADYVFHLAALKHVPVCEENSWEAVLTNIYGTQNVIEAAMANKVKKVIDISTDKAVDPFNHYGVTKACGEKLIINANRNYGTETSFVCIRGGNVMGTNGSVLPLFKKQILEKNEIAITDPTMTRSLMSTREAIGLVLEAVSASVGGEVFVMRMPATTVENIAQVMIDLFGDQTTKKTVIGARSGEKKHEVLVSKNESPRTKVYNDTYYVILPQFNSEKIEAAYGHLAGIEEAEFTSQNGRQLANDEFKEILSRESWLTLTPSEATGASSKKEPAEKRRVVLTGADGFLGQHLTRALANDQTIELIPFVGDILSPTELDEFFDRNHNVDTVIHLAGLVAGNEDQLIAVNSNGTKNLLAAMARRGIKRIVFSSTGAVYQGENTLPAKEDDDARPTTTYGLSKLLAEESIKSLAVENRMQYTILRFANVYGPGSDHGVVASFKKSIQDSGTVVVQGDGTQSRSFVFVEDACEAIIKALNNTQNGLYNVAAGLPYTILELLDIFRQKYSFRVEFAPTVNALSHMVLDSNRIKTELGWKPKREVFAINEI